MAVLEDRLRKRGTDAPGVIEARLEVARREVAQWDRFDYLLLSGTISEDVQRALAIIEAEKLRTCRAAAPRI
jgi:guanylate kinase